MSNTIFIRNDDLHLDIHKWITICENRIFATWQEHEIYRRISERIDYSYLGLISSDHDLENDYTKQKPFQNGSKTLNITKRWISLLKGQVFQIWIEMLHNSIENYCNFIQKWTENHRNFNSFIVNQWFQFWMQSIIFSETLWKKWSIQSPTQNSIF